MSRYRIAVDVGGTFTDMFIYDEESGVIKVAKCPSTPKNNAIGIMDALKKSGVDPKRIVFFSHGSTVGTNALIMRTLPRTGQIATKGFRDVIEIRRGTKEDLWDAYKDVAPPYVRRRDRLEVEERVDYAGVIIKPLDTRDARAVAQTLKDKGVEAIAICFINSFMNGENELNMKKIARAVMGDEVFLSTSHEVAPEIFEHERFSTTVINACLGPIVSKYLIDLAQRLQDVGYEGDVLVMHSGGGVMTAETIGQYAARIANSGPTAGAMAAAYFAQLCGFKNSMGLDMGGTSTDVSLMYEGQMRMTREWWVEYGYPIIFPSVELVSIGAGGGSVAWIDEGGALKNGPRSMGADPGPAAYMKGGEEPTNTDANIVLGRLNTDMFLGGEMKVSRELAERAILQKIARRLGFDLVEAANAMIKMANANMCDAVRLTSVRRGYDPRDFALVVFGGAGPVHGAFLAQELNIPKMIVPPWPGITSAMGCLMVDVRHDISKTYVVEASQADIARLESEYLDMENEALERLKSENVPEDRIQLLRQIDMRYIGQWRSLTISSPRPLGPRLDPVLEKFHLEHDREYAYSRRDQRIEIYGLRVVGLGLVQKPQLPKATQRGCASEALKGLRKVFFEQEGFMDTRVYSRQKLLPGAIIEGPAIIEQMDSTVVIPPDVQAEVDEYLDIIMNIK